MTWQSFCFSVRKSLLLRVTSVSRVLPAPKDIISDRGGIISKLRETKSFLNDPSSSSEKGIVANFDVLAVFIDCPAENLSRIAGGIVRVRRLDCIEYVLCQCLRHARVARSHYESICWEVAS